MQVTDRLRASLGDRYTFEREIGAGGMATVYLARDLKHDREVAIKVLRADLAAVIGAERFLAEVRITARLDHPHILTLIDSGEADGLLYYVMPLVRGESLRAKLAREKQLDFDEALTITRQVGSALDYAHGEGIVHRDIKPENILLHRGEAVLTDFGVALAVREAGGNRLTETGISLGTPQYMSPEQATGERNLDARSDLYSLAAVLYEMLGGEAPVTGATAQAMIATSLRVVRERAVMRALSKVPADRFHSAGEFVRAVETGARERENRSRPLWRSAKWLVAVPLLAVVVGGITWWALRFGFAPRVTARLGAPTQVTFTGQTSDAAISDDGKTIAYRVDQCGTTGCRYGIEIQEVGSATTRRIFDGSSAVTGIRWSPDRRTLMFYAEIGGVFTSALVSSLGGPPTPLGGPINSDFFGADSVVRVNRFGGTESKSFAILGLDGVVRDQVAVVDSSEDLAVQDVMWVPDSPWFITRLVHPGRNKGIYRMVDRHGRRVNGSLQDRPFFQEWASADALWRLVPGQTVGKNVLVRTPFNRRRGTLAASGDTVFVGTVYLFSVTRDGSSVLFTQGSTTYDAWALDLRDAVSGVFPADRKMATATSFVGGLISPDGQRVLISRGSGGPQSHFSVRSFSGGPETPVSIGGLVKLDWADSTTLEYWASKGKRSQLSLLDVRTGETRDTIDLNEAGTLDGPALIFHYLAPDGWAWKNGPDALEVQRRGDANPRTVPSPDMLADVLSISASTDGRQIMVEGPLKSAPDSFAVVLMSTDGSSPTVWATTPAGIGVIGDVIMGSRPIAYVINPLVEPSSMFRFDASGRLKLMATISRPITGLSVSTDLRRVVVGTEEYHGDAWLMHVSSPR